ncbi:MAG: molybdate ABC transporter substrate-binding protein [Nitriliruptorales bacterium]
MRPWTVARLVTLVVVTAAVVLSARAGSTSTSAGGGEGTQELVVFAAASLSDAFEDVGSAFQQEHPDTRVRFNFAGSQQLAGQIRTGAPADVFASADMRQLQAAGTVVAGEPTLFAGNELAIAVERGNPLGVRGLADLGRADLTLVLAAAEVPAGRYARQALERAGVEVKAASLENDVRAALYKVRLGEADAAIVYASDVLAAGDTVTALHIAPAHNVTAAYPMAVLRGAPNPDAAHAFVSFIKSAQAQAVLRQYGFSPPAGGLGRG